MVLDQLVSLYDQIPFMLIEQEFLFSPPLFLPPNLHQLRALLGTGSLEVLSLFLMARPQFHRKSFSRPPFFYTGASFTRRRDFLLRCPSNLDESIWFCRPLHLQNIRDQAFFDRSGSDSLFFRSVFPEPRLLASPPG